MCPDDKPITELYNILKLAKDEHDKKKKEEFRKENIEPSNLNDK